MNSLAEFLACVHSPFDAVSVSRDYLKQHGFQHVREVDQIAGSQPAVLTRDGTALLAWIPGTDLSKGFVSLQSHTDSPALRLLQNGAVKRSGALCYLPVEPYSSIGVGRMLDRKLSLGGRISYIYGGQPKVLQITSGADFFIPSLATHMLRNKDDPKEWVPEGDELCVCCAETICLNGKNVSVKENMTLAQVLAQIVAFDELTAVQLDVTAVEINQFGDFLQAARLDNLASVYASVKALADSYALQPSQETTRVVFAYCHEEIGSLTRSGAHGPALRDFWARLCSAKSMSADAEMAAFHRSLHISADGAHASHPIKGASSCQTPVPVLGSGFCFKMSQRQNYAFSDYLVAVGVLLAKEAGSSYQHWIAKTFKAGGGTIGNIVAADADARVIDCGVPMLGMHSCCETVCMADVAGFYAFMQKALEKGTLYLGQVLYATNE